jgi:hypothetical protein
MENNQQDALQHFSKIASGGNVTGASGANFNVSPVPVSDMYTYGGASIGYVTRYKEGFIPNFDNEDAYGQRQSGLNKALNGLKQFKTLASNSYLNHFASYGRDLEALQTMQFSDLWNTTFGQESAQIARAATDLYPIFETKEQRERRDKQGSGILGQAGISLGQYVPFTGRATNAWANTLGQLGFTAGTIGAVATESLALAALTYATGGGAASLAVAKQTLNVNKIRSIGSFYSMVNQAKNLYTLGRVSGATTTLGKLGANTLGAGRMLIAAQGESALEANFAKLEFIEDQKDKYRRENGFEPSQEFLTRLEEEANKVGNTTYSWNIPVLMASNAVVIGNMFRPKFVNASTFIPSAVKSDIKKGATDILGRGLISNTFKNSPKIHKAINLGKKTSSFIFKENISEGLEEVLQGVGSGAAMNHFDLFSKQTSEEGFGAFMAAAADEFAHAIQSREGWDEFFAGFFTGFGIKGITSGFNKLTGSNKLTQERVKQGIQDLTAANGNYLNFLAQSAISEQLNSAENTGDVKKAKDLKSDAEFYMFLTTSKYGVTNEYIDNFKEQLETLKETDPKQLENILQGRTIDQVVSNMKTRFESFETDSNTLRKIVGNPFEEGTQSYATWDTAVQIAAYHHTQSKDAIDRAQSISRELQQKYPTEEAFITAMLDPSSIDKSITDIQKNLSTQKERLNLELSESERQATEQDIKDSEKNLQVLEMLKSKFYDKDGNLNDRDKITSEETVSDILRGFYGDQQNTLPTELKQSIKDILELELDGAEYLALYNLLSNVDNFKKYGEAFTKSYMNKVRGVENRITQEAEAVEETELTPTTESLTKDDLLTDAQNIDLAEGISEQVEAAAKGVTRTEDGKLLYNGKEYDNTSDLLKDLAKEQDFEDALKQTTTSGKNFGEALTELLNGLVPEAPAATETHIPEEKPKAQPPKTKQENNLERFGFTHNSSNVTVAHYFDNVITRTFKNGIKFVAEKLQDIGYTDIVDQLTEAANNLDNNYTLTTINLMTKEQLLGDNTIESVNDENIQVVYDGVRFFVLTRGTQEEAQQIIQEKLGIGVMNREGKYSLAFRTDADGNQTAIESGFRAGRLGEVNDAAVHKLKRGQEVKLRIADSQFNRNLIAEEKDGKKLLDKLEVEVLNENDEVVGIVRATDFLFEAKRAELDAFRSGLLAGQSSPTLGAVVGTTRFLNFSTARNESTEYINAEETNFTDRDGSEYKKEYFFAREDGQVINEKGEVVPPTNFDRGSFKPGAVYMKLSNKNGKNHTVQLYRESAGDIGAPTFTEEEFTSGAFKAEAQTNLTPYTPIISKRAIIDMSPTETTKDGVTRGVKWGEQEVAATTVEEDYLNIPTTSQEALPETTETFEQRLESAKTKVEEAVTNTPEGVAEISQKSVVDAIKELAQGIAFAKNLKGKKLVEAVKKELEGIIDAEDIDGIAADLENLKPKELRNITVTVNQGAGNVEINLENTELTQESIVAEDGTIIPIAEVVAVVPYTPEAKTPTSEVKTQEWQDVANQPQDVIDQWLRDNAQVGDQFTLSDGTIITVEYNDGGNVIISQDRNGYKLYTAFNTKGERKQVVYIDGKMHLEGKELPEATPEMTEPSETQAEEEATAPTPEENQFITKWKQLISMYGVRGDDMLSILSQVYNESVNQGKPIETLEELLEAANTPQEVREIFRFVTTPVFQAHLWQHLTNAETIWDINGNKRWNQFKEELAPILGSVQNITPGTTPPAIYNNYMANLGKRLKAIFKKTGIRIPDMEKTQFLSLNALQEMAAKISDAFSAENIQEGYRALQKAGLNVTADGLMFVARVARNTIGKNPTSTIDYSSIFTDVAMSSVDGEMYVRNEKDGFFVKIENPQSANFSQEIRNIQKLFLSLYGINMPLSYLAEYNKINGSFENLKARVFAQKQTTLSPENVAFSQVEIKKEQILSDENMLKYQKALVLSDSHDAVYLGTDRYIQIMKTPQGNTVYVKEGVGMSAQRMRNIMDALGISQAAKQKASTFAKQVEKIRGLKNKINDITCK